MNVTIKEFKTLTPSNPIPSEGVVIVVILGNTSQWGGSLLARFLDIIQMYSLEDGVYYSMAMKFRRQPVIYRRQLHLSITFIAQPKSSPACRWAANFIHSDAKK